MIHDVVGQKQHRISVYFLFTLYFVMPIMRCLDVVNIFSGNVTLSFQKITMTGAIILGTIHDLVYSFPIIILFVEHIFILQSE